MAKNKETLLIYDLETNSVDPNVAIPQLMGCKSSISDEFVWTSNIDEMVSLINGADIIVGYNNKEYDDVIMTRYGANFRGKVNIDLMQIIHGKGFGNDMGRKGIITTHDGTHLGTILHGKSLANTTLALGGPLKIGGFDYDLFKHKFGTLTEEQQKLALEYLEADIEATQYIYEYLEEYFANFKDGGITIDGEFRPFMREDQIRKKQYLTASTAAWTYKVVCNLAGLEEKYNNAEHEGYGGGFVALPTQEYAKGDIYCLDYNCFPIGTKIRMWRDSRQFYDKNIEDIKVGDKVINFNGQQEIGAVNKQKYCGDLIVIELENGKTVSCTPDHKFPLKSGEIKEAKDLTEDDELLTTYSKEGYSNSNYKGKTLKMCEVCGAEFEVFKSQEHIKTCSHECANVLKSVNAAKANLGKTWVSKMKGVPRTQEVKDKISKATKKAMQDIDMSTINKNRDMSFMKTLDWHEKVRSSRLNSVKAGKFTYNGIKFRSNWEVILAKTMDKKGINWEYEPKVIKMSNGAFYTPDFYLPDTDQWIEVKGYMYDHSRVKIQQFLDDGNDLLLLDDIKTITDEETQWLK